MSCLTSGRLSCITTTKCSGVRSFISFSHGDTSNSDGGVRTVIPRTQPIAAPMSLSQKAKSSERSTWRRCLWGRPRKATHHVTHIPLERCYPHGHLTAREAGEHGRAVLLGQGWSGFEWSDFEWLPGSTSRVKIHRQEGPGWRKVTEATIRERPGPELDTSVRGWNEGEEEPAKKDTLKIKLGDSGRYSMNACRSGYQFSH